MTQAEKAEAVEKKVTAMILEVDLKCYSCYKKVKKLLSKYPQIRDQMFDEDKNKVMITVVCCNPEKIRDELCCKGGKTIQTIEILEPKRKKKSHTGGSSPTTQDHEKVGKKTGPPPPDPNHEKIEIKTGPPPLDDNREKFERKPSGKTENPFICCQECYEGRGGGPCHYGYSGHGPPPVSICCHECSEGRSGGPCHYGYGSGITTSQGPYFDTYRYPYPGNRPYYITRCDDYFNEENPQGCSII